MNALRVLMSHHDRIEGLLVDLSQAVELAREALFRDLTRSLERHLEVEETVVFPTVAPRLILVKAAPFADEHKDIREALAQMGGTLSGPDFLRKLEELHDVVVRHISDEEIELFAEVKRRFDVDELDELGERIEQAMQAMQAGGPLEQRPEPHAEQELEPEEEAENHAEPPE